jgi:DNA-binding CsgD family transcriptional regulator
VSALRAGVPPARVREVFEKVRGSSNVAVRDDDEGWTLHVEAALAAAEGDHARAVEAFRATLERPRRRPGIVIDSDVQMGLAQSLLALGRLDEARACVDEATRLLARWKGWRVEQLEALQRRLAVGAARGATGELTARERDVAILVAQGLSNGEIGRKLYISTKTASVHVSNILAKLHMTSRSQIAAWASSEGLV